jgi:hypothetical protein
MMGEGGAFTMDQAPFLWGIVEQREFGINKANFSIELEPFRCPMS